LLGRLQERRLLDRHRYRFNYPGLGITALYSSLPYRDRLTGYARTLISTMSASTTKIGADHARAQVPELAVLQGLVAPRYSEWRDAVGPTGNTPGRTIRRTKILTTVAASLTSAADATGPAGVTIRKPAFVGLGHRRSPFVVCFPSPLNKHSE
jgi:hypothetical protein